MDADTRQAVALETLSAWCSETSHLSSGVVRPAARSQAGVSSARRTGCAPLASGHGEGSSLLHAKSRNEEGASHDGACLHATARFCQLFWHPCVVPGHVNATPTYRGCDARVCARISRAVRPCFPKNDGLFMSTAPEQACDNVTPNAESRRCMTLREQQDDNLRAALIAHQKVRLKGVLLTHSAMRGAFRC